MAFANDPPGDAPGDAPYEYACGAPLNPPIPPWEYANPSRPGDDPSGAESAPPTSEPIPPPPPAPLASPPWLSDALSDDEGDDHDGRRGRLPGDA